MGEKDCICGVCSCGKHKMCKPVRITEAPLDANTEYVDNYKKFPMEVRRGRPAPQELTVGGEFYGQTESRDQFIPHPVPPRPQARKATYVANDAVLESETTQRRDYQKWPQVNAPKRKEREHWVSTSGAFDGSTTSKSDYIQFPLPPHFVRRQQPYVKSEAKLEGVSTQTEDFKNWGVTSVPVRRKAALQVATLPEDRDFKSTTTASYVGHNIKRELVRAPQHLTTDHGAQFEGMSTNREAFQVWPIPPRHQRHKAQYIPTEGPFDGQTTYKDTYQPKTAERYVHPTPVYVANEAKFEGMSTHKTDFLPTGKVQRIKDFSPRNDYVNIPDDRDFVSTMRGQHTPKDLPHCQAGDWMKLAREVSKDGHMRLTKSAIVGK